VNDRILSLERSSNSIEVGDIALRDITARIANKIKTLQSVPIR
jgi:hypothetical protein